MPSSVVIDDVPYRPVDKEEVERLAELIRSFTLSGSEYWRDLFIESDTAENGERHGGYEDGDENRPFFTEGFLYNLLGKEDARSVLGIMRRLCALAGVPFR